MGNGIGADVPTNDIRPVSLGISEEQNIGAVVDLLLNEPIKVVRAMIEKGELMYQKVEQALREIGNRLLREEGMTWFSPNQLHCRDYAEGYGVVLCTEGGEIPLYDLVGKGTLYKHI